MSVCVFLCGVLLVVLGVCLMLFALVVCMILVTLMYIVIVFLSGFCVGQ